METGYADYRQKWRLQRRRTRLRRVPLVALGVVLLAIVGYVSTRRPRPQLGAVAWVQDGIAQGFPRIALGEGTLVAAWEYGSVTAQTASTGSPLWPTSFDRAHQFDGPPAVGADRIVLGGSDGCVRCVELRTGQPVWGFDAATIVRSTPLIVGDRVYVGGDDGRLYCLSFADGTLVWAYPSVDQADRGAILGGAAAARGVVVCGSCEGEAVGLDAATGRLRWRIGFDGPVIARVTAEGDLAYIVGENGDVRCVSVDRGETVWTKGLPCLTRQPVVVTGRRAFIVASDGVVHCVEARTGRDLWRRKLRGRPTTSAVAGGQRLYVGTSDGLIEALSLESGDAVWRWYPGSKPLGDLLLDTRNLYCTTAEGRIFAVRTERPA